MFKLLLISIVLVPVLLGATAGLRRSARGGFVQVVGLTLAYNIFYVLMLYYLRVRWVG